jgi:hypothetical protein
MGIETQTTMGSRYASGRSWKRRIALFPLACVAVACGGGGDGGSGSGGTGGTPPTIGTYYVDASGACANRHPCYTTLRAAVSASFDSQFEVNATSQIVRAKRPSDPPDDIIVMPGVHRSSRVGDWVLLLGLNGETFPPGTWKLRLPAEQGPTLTTISGDGTGPCIWITDYIDLEIKGFTVTGCAIVTDSLVNEHSAVYIQTWSHARIQLEGNQILPNGSIAAIGIHPYFGGFREVAIQIVRNGLIGNHSGVVLDGFPVIADAQNTAQIVVANNLIVGSNVSMSSDPATGIIGWGTIKAEQNLRIDIIHNTIVGYRDFGINVTDGHEMKIQSNVVFGNRFDIYGGTVGTTGNLVGEASNLRSVENLVGDPMFVDAQHGNYALQPRSPAIDSAVTTTSAEAGMDYKGTLRPQDGDRNGTAVADIGAFEYVP